MKWREFSSLGKTLFCFLWFVILMVWIFECSRPTHEYATWSKWVRTVPLPEAEAGFEITADTTILVETGNEGMVVGFAARQLKAYLLKMSGLDLPIRSIEERASADAQDQKIIVLGQK